MDLGLIFGVTTAFIHSITNLVHKLTLVHTSQQMTSYSAIEPHNSI